MSPEHSVDQDKQRFEQLLPFFITRQLGETDRFFVETYLARHPDAHHALKFTERLGRIVRDTGAGRNADQALQRLLANYQPRRSLRQRLLAKLRALGISPPVALALFLLLGQGAGYGIYKLGLSGTSAATVAAPVRADLTITLKRGAEMSAVIGILDRFGASIVHSDLAGDAGKLLISIIDQSRIQALIDALMEVGLIESVAVLL